MKKILSIAIVVLMALGLMIPVFASAATADPGQTLFVNCADGRRLNVRQAPNKNAKMLYQVECGTKLEVLAGGEAAKGLDLRQGQRQGCRLRHDQVPAGEQAREV